MDENICCVNIWNKNKLAKTFSSPVTDAIRLGTGYRNTMEIVFHITDLL